MKQMLVAQKRANDEMSNHLYSIMLVYIWGSFETYILMLFEELFNKKPQMLKTSDVISYKEVLDNAENILTFLIQKELATIGHFGLSENLVYLEKKLNVTFPKPAQERLKQIYLLRNIIAHNTGIVNTTYSSKIPSQIKIKNNELLISKTFIQKEIIFIESTVNKIETQIQKKFYKNAV